MSEQSSERADTEHARLILENIVQFSQAARRIDMLNIRKLFYGDSLVRRVSIIPVR